MGQAMPPPSDPWAGSASVPDVPPTTVEPYVVYVERPRRRRWPWVLGTIALVAVVCCVGAFVLTDDIRAQYPARVDAGPTQIAGFTRERGSDVDTVTQKLVTQIRAEHDVEDAFAVVLSDPESAQRPMVVFGATLFVLDPAGEMEKALHGVDQNVTGVASYPARGVGGELRCGNGTDSEQHQPIVICAWIDHGSIGVGVFYGERSMDDSAATLRSLRDAIIVRG